MPAKYPFFSSYRLSATREAVWEALKDVEAWPSWWRWLKQVETTKPWMNLLAPLGRPAFRWNHDRLMTDFGRGLADAAGTSVSETRNEIVRPNAPGYFEMPPTDGRALRGSAHPRSSGSTVPPDSAALSSSK